ncbi:MAG: hypothetical protein K0Q74_504 [Gammaproteobacteria bacterium]|nr:hypothetical protein [Gammaproteobacteria bacterium]
MEEEVKHDSSPEAQAQIDAKFLREKLIEVDLDLDILALSKISPADDHAKITSLVKSLTYLQECSFEGLEILERLNKLNNLLKKNNIDRFDRSLADLRLVLLDGLELELGRVNSVISEKLKAVSGIGLRQELDKIIVQLIPFLEKLEEASVEGSMKSSLGNKIVNLIKVLAKLKPALDKEKEDSLKKVNQINLIILCLTDLQLASINGFKLQKLLTSKDLKLRLSGRDSDTLRSAWGLAKKRLTVFFTMTIVAASIAFLANGTYSSLVGSGLVSAAGVGLVAAMLLAAIIYGGRKARLSPSNIAKILVGAAVLMIIGAALVGTEYLAETVAVIQPILTSVLQYVGITADVGPLLLPIGIGSLAGLALVFLVVALYIHMTYNPDLRHLQSLQDAAHHPGQQSAIQGAGNVYQNGLPPAPPTSPNPVSDKRSATSASRSTTTPKLNSSRKFGRSGKESNRVACESEKPKQSYAGGPPVWDDYEPVVNGNVPPGPVDQSTASAAFK